MHAPPLVAFAGGACPASAASSLSPWLASLRPAIVAAPARLLWFRRGALRLEAKAAWRATGGGRGPRVPAKGAVLASYMGAEEVVGPLSLLDEEELILHIRKERDNGKLPADVAINLEELYYNYRNAVLQNGDPNAYEIMLSNMTALFDRVLLDVQNPFTFPPYHKAVREPFDYYMFGQNYIRPLVDFRNSYVGNISLFHDMEEKLHQAHFDSSTVDNMRRLLEHAGVPGHIYPLSLLCYEVMPPPQQVEKEIGEQRVISFHGVGLSATEETKYGDITCHTKNADEVCSQ
ncbi:Glycerol-3-phosphate acyltransferase chloroplastic [Zea mays]|uniref:glycerol-3-phosphate 1-O-acyltransferase n=1 Tax=Zea mays TaxID=4577 RepID=A0A1D6KA30_MAIZE|nr:Glycerol-3-phosphate acyltransferase chloroplastic [Zea mays]